MPYNTMTFSEFMAKLETNAFDIPPEGRLRVTIDNDAVVASIHPGWDDDGEELGDPVYLARWCPEELLYEVFNRLDVSVEYV